MKKMVMAALLLFTQQVFAIGAYITKTGDDWSYRGDGVSDLQVGDEAIALIYSDPNYQTMGVRHAGNSVMTDSHIYMTAWSMPGYVKFTFRNANGAISPSDVPSGSVISVGSYVQEPTKVDPPAEKKTPEKERHYRDR